MSYFRRIRILFSNFSWFQAIIIFSLNFEICSHFWYCLLQTQNLIFRINGYFYVLRLLSVLQTSLFIYIISRMNLLNFIDVSVNIEIVICSSSTFLRLVYGAQFVLVTLTYGLNGRLFYKPAFIFRLREPWNRWIILDIKAVLVMILHAQVVASIMVWLLIGVHRRVVPIGGPCVRVLSLLCETV